MELIAVKNEVNGEFCIVLIIRVLYETNVNIILFISSYLTTLSQ